MVCGVSNKPITSRFLSYDCNDDTTQQGARNFLITYVVGKLREVALIRIEPKLTNNMLHNIYLPYHT